MAPGGGCFRAGLAGGSFAAEDGNLATDDGVAVEAVAGLAIPGVNGEGVCKTTDRFTKGGVTP